MRALIQRVSSAAVAIDGQTVGRIDQGLVILLGVGRGDSSQHADYLAQKCVNLRVFPDEGGNMNRSLLDVAGEALIVSQFTLYGDTRGGRRPSFTDAAPPELSEPLYEAFCARVRLQGVKVATGRFRAMMRVTIQNEGPVTFMLESK